VVDAAGLEALAARGVVECRVNVDESQLESLDAARGLTSVLGLRLTENQRLTDIDLIEDFKAPFELIVADTPLASDQAVPPTASAASLANTDIVTLSFRGESLDRLVLERNEELTRIDGPQLTTLGEVILADLPRLALAESLLSVSSCSALSVEGAVLASTADIEGVAQRCRLATFHHCGNLDDEPC